MHVKFSGGAKIVFTHNGKPISDPIKKPTGANDFHAVWDEATGQITKFWWTRNGDIIGQPIQPPPGANDLELRVTNAIKQVVWTHDGTRIGGISVPVGVIVNDLHLVLRPLA